MGFTGMSTWSYMATHTPYSPILPVQHKVSILTLHIRFSSIKLLLTNTLVPRDTKSLVAAVSAKRLVNPEIVDPVLDAIQIISDKARGLLGGRESVDRSSLIKELAVSRLNTLRASADEDGPQALIRENQGHLVMLGVSHPSLEMVVSATSSHPFDLSTKLTGAGGGGCALTLIPDGMSRRANPSHLKHHVLKLSRRLP